MNIKITDLQQRELALDPSKSFIVQAPAGSGKTSLLVQRYLKLLASVQNPEEIVAITFTRKAASEMRNRIIIALKKADQNIYPQDQCETITQKLALAALKQNQNKNWDITKNPHRLRIQTIDSFCNYLVKRMPLLAKFSINPKIIKNQEAETFYREAAQTILESAQEPEYLNYLETLLLHLDNDWQRAENLFIAMLKSREQWLPHIVGLKNEKSLRHNMENDLKIVAEENLEHCLKFFPKNLQQELQLLLNFAKSNFTNPPTFLQQITAVKDFSKLDINNFKALANFLLTKDFFWRKKITKEYGFPASTSGRTKEEKELFKTMKKHIENLLLKFSEHENFRISLENLLCSPPQKYSDEQWKMIEALFQLLPLLVAQLKLIFKERHVTDYAEISMAALHALGNNDTPSELALNLDYRLQHLLVDEFQDTSVAQYRLIEKLITTWQPNDGRTLFVVGDPMQSIYRFREAEVGLFLRAQNTPLNMLQLQPITLTTNFRSNKNIIDWINNNLSKIFPKISDICFGAVPFCPSTAIKQEQNSRVKVELLNTTSDTNAETIRVITNIQKLQKQYPEDTIAVLVRARSHLQEIITAMQNAHLDYQAYELQTLEKSIAIRDLFALTRALFHLADRTAWLAILRAPWCGVNLKDLHLLANGKFEIIWDNICNYQELNLSEDGKILIEKLKTTLLPIVANRGRILNRDLIENAWLALGGPATVSNEIELEYAKIYLKLLETNNLDIELIQKKLQELYAPATSTAKIQIMTIHKAKGLEFDHVIIPGIDRATKSDTRKLMLWFERPNIHGGSSLLLAPIEATGNETDPIYKYLQLVEEKKNRYETGRLLYVAITRAKRTVHIIGYTNQKTQKDSLLKQLTNCYNENWIIKEFEIATKNETKTTNKLQRLNKDWTLPITIKMPKATLSPTWQFLDKKAAILGTAIHICLKQISESDLEFWDDKNIEIQKPYWTKILHQLGYNDIDFGLKTITKAIKLTLANERGKWILTKHESVENELVITTTVNNKTEQYIIDRTFIDQNGIRWIIDYKTSQPDKENLDEFLQKEQIKYTPQLLNYAKLMKNFDKTKPIKLGLYFPLFNGWIEI